uniref:RNA-directed DNA polymerase n=1 Tax=Strongyloides papillosus TaxID=174720 RepID=A0A0N5C168_STREA
MPTSTWKHYDNIINELKENTGLHLYIPGYPIEVHCDASSYGIGGMLCQRVPQHILDGHDLKIGKHKDEVLVPLSFYSKTLPSVKRKRCPTFTEIYSILHCLRYWSYILYNIEFSVFSDHKPLVSLRVSSSIPKFVEILTELESYNFTLYYIEGPKNHFPDYLSRLQKPPDVTSAIPCDFKNLNIPSNNSTVDPMTQMLLRLNRYLKSNDFLNFQDDNDKIQQLLLNKKLGNLLIRRDKSKIIKIRTQLMGSEEYIWLPLITSEKLKDIVPNLDSHLMKTVLEEFVYVLTDNGKEAEINMTINNETPTINWDNINLEIALENDVFLEDVKKNEDKWRNFKFFKENDIYKVKDELDSDSKSMIYIPTSLEETIFDMLHKKANHPSYDKMRIMLKEIFIPSKTKKLLDYLRKCSTCLQRNIALKSDNQKLKPVKMDEVYTTLSFDYLGEIEADTKGRKYILVVICNASTFIWSFPMRTTGTQELLKKLHKMFTQFGRPEKLHRDNARGNLGKELLEYCNSWKIQTSTSTPNYSRSNCLVERKLRDMQAILSKKLIDYKMSRTKVYWSDLLPEVTYQLNTTPILKCEVTPFQIMFSRKGRNYLDLFLQRYSPYESSKADPIFQSSKLALDIVQEHQQAERFRHRERVNVNKNNSPKIKVGQSVYLKDSNPRKAKLSSHYKGPYEVHEIASNHVIITDKNGKKIKCHIKNLKILPSNN